MDLLNINYQDYLIVSACIFVIGLVGLFINTKSLIRVLMCIELILLSANINFVTFSIKLDDLTGQVFSLFVLTVAAAEAAIALAILVVFYRERKTIAIDKINSLKG